MKPARAGGLYVRRHGSVKTGDRLRLYTSLKFSEVFMSDLVDELSRKARALPPEDRVRLAEELLATIQEADPDVEAAWDAEIKRRIAEINSGTAKLIPAEEVFAEVRRLIK